MPGSAIMDRHSELRAAPAAWQDSPSRSRQKFRKKGGLHMKKIVSIIFSWIFFVSGIVVEETFLKVVLLSVARVLPSALVVN
jgi:hypothetical protein